jgi:hypothetical protein
VRKVGIVSSGLDLECEGGGESAVTVCYVAEEEAIRLERIGGEQEATDGEVLEMIRSFKNRWSGVSTFGMTITDEEAGDVVFDEVRLQVCEETRETLVVPAAITRE